MLYAEINNARFKERIADLPQNRALTEKEATKIIFGFIPPFSLNLLPYFTSCYSLWNGFMGLQYS